MTPSSNQKKIIDISKELGLSHVGSNLSCLPVLEEIYKIVHPGDFVILDNAHAHLAHLVVMESHHLLPLQTVEGEAKRLIGSYGIHCERKAGCDASGGSLGHGLGIGIGYALANPEKDIYVIVSDGSLQEGSSWEALCAINDMRIKNIHVYANLNGYTAVAQIDRDSLYNRLKAFLPSVNARYTDNVLDELQGVVGHYKILE